MAIKPAVQFVHSFHCTSRAHCASCRAHAAWRAQYGAPDVCPWGIESTPAAAAVAIPTQVVLPPHGPGTELKKLLSRIGIVPSPNCKCNARAAQMDAQGIPWCQQNIPLIVSWLKEEAALRHLPFFAFPSAQLVRIAIRHAKKRDSLVP